MALVEQSPSARRAWMVATQLEGRGLDDARLLDAMGEVPRELFVPSELAEQAYDDSALPIGYGQTISQPFMVARTCELAACRPEDRVLEVGAGSGYEAAVLSRLAAHVISIEVIPALAARARAALAAGGFDNVEIVVGDGSLGYPPGAPYDRIVVAAAAPTVPYALLDQLADSGRIVIPVGRRDLQTLRVIDRHGLRFDETDHDACVFVPLVGDEGWPDRAR